jgi:replication factor C subunit 2/4
MNSIPWTEKYKPEKLEEIYGNKKVVNRFQSYVKNKNLSHLILVGETGIGKTSCIRCLTKELIDKDLYNDAVLELNASEDRGINTVRTKIKMFAQKKIFLKKSPFKIIVLDESDSMTDGAQQALRRIIEKYTHNTRFIFICNDVTQIIEPIQSRCAIFKMGIINDKEIKEILTKICNLEKILYDDEGLETLLLTSPGDIRKAINNLQSAYSGYKIINSDNILKICDIPEPKILNSIIKYITKNKFVESMNLINNISSMGFSNTDIVNTLLQIIKKYPFKSEKNRLLLIKELGITNIRLINGVDSKLQLFGMLVRMCNIYKKN